MAIRRLLLALLLALPIVAVDAKKDSQKESSKPKSPNAEKVAQLIVDGTNEFREQEGQRHVHRNPQLDETALYFARFMAEHKKFGHEADNHQPAERAKQHGYDYCIVLENIAYQFDSRGFTADALSHDFVEGWKNSAGHRKNMLNGDITEIGVAIAHSEKDDHYYAVQMFGRPKSDSTEFTIVNGAGIEASYKLNTKAYSLPPNYTRTHQQCGSTTLELSGAPAVNVGNGDRYEIIAARPGKLQLKKN